MKKTNYLDFALSPCPNDTYIFYKFIHSGNYKAYFYDIEELNQLALKESLPLIKVSCVIAVQLDSYIILKSGGAIGYGCGPIVISNFQEIQTESHFLNHLYDFPIYIPGKTTTANFLFHQFCYDHHINPSKVNIHFIRYDKIIETLKNGEPAFGILIHEERFTYKKFHFNMILDLGEWWEDKTKLPIPLGCIVLHKDYLYLKSKIEKEIQESIEYSKNNFEIVYPFIKHHAQSLEDMAILSHINLYVTDFSYDMGEKGKETIQKLKTFILNQTKETS